MDTYLLATPAAVGKIDALQQFLQQSGMTGVTVLTPERVYRFGRSKYGARAATSSSSLPQRHRHAACFSVVVDTSRKKARLRPATPDPARPAARTAPQLRASCFCCCL